MKEIHFDSTVDWLADAPLNSEQRSAWNLLRVDLANARALNHELREKIARIENSHPDLEPTVLSRPEFNREVARMLAFDERYGGISSVIYFNFDHIEETATRYSRSVANAVIRQIGVILMKGVRGSDVVGRLAPDEFGVLLMRCDNAFAWRKGEELAASLHKGLAEIHGFTLDIAISYGAYTFNERQDVATGLKEAAQMMTRATKPNVMQ